MKRNKFLLCYKIYKQLLTLCYFHFFIHPSSPFPLPHFSTHCNRCGGIANIHTLSLAVLLFLNDPNCWEWKRKINVVIYWRLTVLMWYAIERHNKWIHGEPLYSPISSFARPAYTYLCTSDTFIATASANARASPSIVNFNCSHSPAWVSERERESKYVSASEYERGLKAKLLCKLNFARILIHFFISLMAHSY